jgi:flagellar basal body-associated protein FliL
MQSQTLPNSAQVEKSKATKKKSSRKHPLARATLTSTQWIIIGVSAVVLIGVVAGIIVAVSKSGNKAVAPNTSSNPGTVTPAPAPAPAPKPDPYADLKPSFNLTLIQRFDAPLNTTVYPQLNVNAKYYKKWLELGGGVSFLKNVTKYTTNDLKLSYNNTWTKVSDLEWGQRKDGKYSGIMRKVASDRIEEGEYYGDSGSGYWRIITNTSVKSGIIKPFWSWTTFTEVPY